MVYGIVFSLTLVKLEGIERSEIARRACFYALVGAYSANPIRTVSESLLSAYVLKNYMQIIMVMK